MLQKNFAIIDLSTAEPPAAPRSLIAADNDDGDRCPTRNSTHYNTADGEFFYIRCGFRHVEEPLYTTVAASFDDCIHKCAREQGCHSVGYAPAGSVCVLQTKAAPVTYSDRNESWHYAYETAPPTYQAAAEKTMACSTTCPYGRSSTSDCCMLDIQFLRDRIAKL